MKKEVIELILDAQELESVPVEPVPAGNIVGTVTKLNEAGQPLVKFKEIGEPLVARSTVAVTQAEIGKEVVLTFERGDLRMPIILGILQCAAAPGHEVHLDGERLVLSADKEIVLKCGESSITLTRAGKVLIRGAYLSSRSSGVNRIKGGSVQIN